MRGLPESFGELPAVCLAEEIDTPGDGQVRAVITIAGNPVLSTPNGGRLDAALDALDFMVCVDIYVNETTRHADVILPVPDALQKRHYDLALLQLAIRNVANYSPALLPLEPDQLDEWEVLAKLALVLQGAGADAEPVDRRRPHDRGRWWTARRPTRRRPIHGRDPAEHPRRARRPAPARSASLDLMLRTGPYGDGFGADGRRASASTCSSPTRTASTSARSSPACPTRCARRAA